jgi:hypothetical protein
MGELTFETLINQLKSAVYEVTFMKVNGEKRVMPCTLLSEYLPESDSTKVHNNAEVNKSVIRAYAIDKQAWRSFKVENVISTSLVD